MDSSRQFLVEIVGKVGVGLLSSGLYFRQFNPFLFSLFNVDYLNLRRGKFAIDLSTNK